MNILKCFSSRANFFILWLFFNFKQWHFRSTYYCTPYKKNLVQLVNKHIKISDTTIEIGCGLGEIIRRIKCQNKFGIDKCQKVLNAAKFYNRNKDIIFISRLPQRKNMSVDNLILINFMHEQSNSQVINSLKSIIKKYKPNKIFLDSYHEDSFKHLRHHNFIKIFSHINNYIMLKKIITDDKKRYLYVFKKDL